MTSTPITVNLKILRSPYTLRSLVGENTSVNELKKNIATEIHMKDYDIVLMCRGQTLLDHEVIKDFHKDLSDKIMIYVFHKSDLYFE